MNENYDFEIEDEVVEILNKNLIKAIFEMLYKKELINKTEHTLLMKEV